MIDEVELDRWQYTRTLTSNDLTRVLRHNPQQSEFAGWSLVELNGEVPNIETQWSFLQKYIDSGQYKSQSQLTRLVQPNSLNLLQNNEKKSVYSFTPNMPNFIDQQGFDGKLWFDIQHQYVTRLRISAKEPVMSASGLKFSAFELEMKFDQVKGFVVPQEIATRLTAQLNGVNAFSQNNIQKYSDFRLINPPPTLAEMLTD
ncbi:hypothetical protein [Echinimonas agarilytica]|uniref:Uncharacterized protein n=1 Tax=Echinimonas agarilytica TaxID=1215918 RepID=A0AA42B8Y0_9GAMM|nr:hypothetical protein [Echinimonas agarilytica]MCM2681008.1 hypothetical protein [Echinimonas agarilytica]